MACGRPSVSYLPNELHLTLPRCTPPTPLPPSLPSPAVDMQQEFHLLTLQIIGEAILSLDPQECDRVFPHLYIPVRMWPAHAPTPPRPGVLPLPTHPPPHPPPSSCHFGIAYQATGAFCAWCTESCSTASRTNPAPPAPPTHLLQVMEESNARVLAPWRKLYPTTAWRYASKVRAGGPSPPPPCPQALPAPRLTALGCCACASLGHRSAR